MDIMNIGLELKTLRKSAKITQNEFAKRADLSLRFVRELEQGKPTICVDKLLVALNFFGYSMHLVKTTVVEQEKIRNTGKNTSVDMSDTINFEELDKVIHDIVMIANVMKCLEHSFTPGQCKILDGCIIRLYEIRQTIVESIDDRIRT